MPALPEELLAGFPTDRVPGAALAVVRSGTPVLTYCHGMANLEWRQPVTPTTMFRLASVSKPFTALTILLLADEGLLDLDAPITKYLPEQPEHWHGITVRHLLTHTSGIPNFVLQPEFADRTSRIDHTDADIRALFSALPPNFEPGTRYAYSNSGYRLLDMIAAEASGTKFADLLADRIFHPAGMVDSRLLSDDDIIPERASGYRGTDDGFVNAPYVSLTIPGGAGGIGSTLADLVRFDAALRHGVFADVRLHERMYTPVRLACGRTEGYGAGWGLSTYRGRHIKHHTGGIEGFSSLYLRIPEEDASLIMLTNLERFYCVVPARRLIDRMFDLPRAEPKPIDLPQPALEARAGTYTDTISEFTVTAAPGHLLLRMGGRTHRMLPVHAATYVDEEDSDHVLRFHDDDPNDAATVTFPLWWCTGYRVPSSAYVDER